MGRRVSSGRVGAPTFGGLLAAAQTITTDDNADIVMDPTGTGRVLVDAHMQVQNQSNLRFGDADDSNYVAFQSPTTVSADVTWTLPDSDGSNRQIMQTDGNATLSFVDPAITLTDEGVSSSNFNLLFSDETGTGTLDQAFIDNGVILYQPSTETLSVNARLETITSENVQTTSYTLALTDRNKAVTMNNSGSVTVTVPPNSSVAFPVGSRIYITRIGSGTVALAAGSGVTLSKTGNLAQNEEITLRKRDTDSWIVDDADTFVDGSGGDSTSSVGTYTSHSFTSTGSSTFTVNN